MQNRFVKIAAVAAVAAVAAGPLMARDHGPHGHHYRPPTAVMVLDTVFDFLKFPLAAATAVNLPPPVVVTPAPVAAAPVATAPVVTAPVCYDWAAPVYYGPAATVYHYRRPAPPPRYFRPAPPPRHHGYHGYHGHHGPHGRR